ncbi:9242_t:CDS:2 [Cetraspora pellucida]|uniref:9242_t:CDS:1 n=1 Tax=Cetraspora pellucida TaxID=1433469 RepID=A0A9N8VCJ0_9GLOM|nr:9242_t:CDS:2 [Cetraspora pellucida]
MSTANVDVPSLEEKADEEEYEQHCLLFPTYATKHSLDESKNPDITDNWNIRVRGWAFSAPKTSRSRDLFIGLASRIVGISEADARYELLKTRSNLFWASNVDKEEFIVKVAGLTASDKMAIEGDSKESEEDPKKILNNVNEEIKDKIAEQHQQPDDNNPFTIFKPHTGNVNGNVSIQQAIVNEWIGKPTGKEKKSLIEGTKEVPGMPELYHKWYDRGVAIHYVSNSPWQLFPMLRAFFDESDFPPGSAHLKFYDGLFKSAREQKQHPMESKFVYIRELLRDFPQRKFILVGDTGEYDPEIDEHESQKLKRQQSLSNRLMKKLHTEMSSIYTSISSSALPEHKHDVPSDVDIDSHDKPVEKQKMRTPLEMFHERLNNLKKGIPDGVFSTFVDPNELENDPIIKSALAY